MEETIVALATPQGNGAIGVIRLSGVKSFDIIEKIFFAKSNKNLLEEKPNTIHFGKIKKGNEILDEVLVSIFKNPKSYTGEDLIEISCHNSKYIIDSIIQLSIENGARLASAGEFTLRAYINGKLDLSQAEAVADIIASENKSSHNIAMQQMRGGYSEEIFKLRNELIDFTSLIELELDFSEEDLEFADRTKLKELVFSIKNKLKKLVGSFKLGNAIKEGIPISIIGQPNVGKSSLLNSIFNEDKAIVSDIEGTTRDIIEDFINIEGVKFRFLDTAGIRKTDNKVEKLGVEKSFKSIEKSQIILYMIDLSKISFEEDYNYINKIKSLDKNIILIANKKDIKQGDIDYNKFNINKNDIIEISAKGGDLEKLKNKILEKHNKDSKDLESSIIITNSRHYEHFLKSYEAILKVEESILKNISGDLLSMDIKDALYHLGQITGDIDIDTDILGNIFGKFCIGK